MDKTRTDAINQLFLQYRRTFESGDAQQIADFYRFPLHYYPERCGKQSAIRTQFTAQVNRLLSIYGRLGVSQIVGAVTQISELNTCSNLVELRWVLLRREGDSSVELYTATTRYLVSDTPAGLKIDGLIAVDETACIRRALAGASP
ncbi:hypothetical protein [Microbulbifer sp. TYP-18]|uniref:hypothetical protein n=1 Tax=Microbulbifer sp. TYP-18 TaxID=3230024 RepID=UPI0034C5E02B